MGLAMLTLTKKRWLCSPLTPTVNGKRQTARKKYGKSNGAIRCALQLIKPPRRWVMLDIPPDGYMPMGWTASQFACNVVIILAILALISFLRSLR